MRTILAVLATLLAGCSMVPAYHRPTLPVPDAWSRAGDGATALDRTWWRSFGDPALDALVARSLGGNFDLQAARALGITVCGTQSQPHGAPELTWALLMAIARNIPGENANFFSGKWQNKCINLYFYQTWCHGR